MKYFLKDNGLLITFLSVLTVIVFVLMNSIAGFITSYNDSYEPIDDVNTSKKDESERNDISSKRNISFLMLGTDNPSKDSGDVRTDSIIVATYNSKKNSVEMVRIPRDLYVDYKGYEGKINGIYQERGLSELRDVIERYTGVPITNYVITDFNGLESVVDSIDGIRINSDIEIDDSNNKEVGNVHVKKGIVTLNGKEALAYSRIRKIDNDIERGKRQEQVIKAIVNKLTSANQLPRIEKNVREVSKHVSMDISLTDVLSYSTKIKETPKMNIINFDWNSFDYQNQSFVNISESQRQEISEKLRNHLGISQLDTLENETLKPEEEKSKHEKEDEEETD